MALSFPTTSLIDGQVYTYGGNSWVYNLANNTWTGAPFGTTATNSLNIYFSGQSYIGSTSALPTSVALRDSSANIYANTFYGNTFYGANMHATIFYGTATSAYYADLAEIYATDQEYPVGTVVRVGGNSEVTAITTSDCYVLGAISTNPAYLMNRSAIGQPVALTGRVPMLVAGPVKKGDPIWPYMNGAGWNQDNGKQPFAFALEDGGPGLVECVIK